MEKTTNNHTVYKDSPAHTSSESRESKDEELEIGLCGYNGCRPSWLQRCNTPKVYLIFFCLFVFVQSFLVSGINNVNTTSLERRFDLPSSQVGLISGAYDFSAGSTVILVSYFGGQGHKPRWIAFAALAVGTGGFIMSLPHFATGLYSGVSQGHTCSFNDTTLCKSDSSLKNYLYVFILGMVVIGIGGTTLYSVGTSFVDESVALQDSGFYIGIFYAVATLGPAMGYILGGQFINTYTDFDKVDTSKIKMTTSDPGWVGAWWIGYLFSGILGFVIAVVLFAYPRHLKGAAEAKKSREVSLAHDNGAEVYTSNPDFGKSIKDMPKAFKILVTNPPFMCLAVAGTIDALVLSGFSTFLPKFIQNQFNQDAGWSAMLAGFVVIPGACGGQILGGYLLKRFGMSIKKAMMMMVISSAIATGLVAVFWFSCSAANMAGINTPYPNSTLDVGKIDSVCNAACQCTTESYNVVCAHDSISNTQTQLFSPCHAGCTTQIDDKTYGNCSCILGNSNTTLVKSGKCQGSCTALEPFLVLTCLLIFFTFMTLPAGAYVTLRCVPDSQRAFGLGVQWVFIRFLGSFPGPIMFGAVIDHSCLVWRDKCGERGSCWIYDNQDMSMNIFLLALAVKIPVCVFYYLAKVVYKAPKASEKSFTLTTMDEGNRPVLGTNGLVSENDHTEEHKL